MRYNTFLSVSLSALSLACAMGTAQVANAETTQPQATTDQSRASSDAGDIIVTAQRREQSALKVPLSLTAIDDTLMKSKQVSALSDLQFVAPGIRTGQQQGMNRIFIRGIGLSSFAAGADSSIAFYVDGVYIGRPTQQLSAVYDVSRIEVLRGPQGALYGRNATGGAVNVITNAPEREFGGYVNVTLGNYDMHQAEGALNVPLSEGGDLRMRTAFKLVDRSGYGYDFGSENEVNDAHSQSVRTTLQYNPNSDVDIKLIGEYTREHDHNYYVTNFGPYQFSDLSNCPYTNGIECQLEGVAEFGGSEIRNSQDALTAIDLFKGPSNRRKGYALTLNATFALGDSLSLNSITGWRKFHRYNSSNADGTDTGIGNVDYNERNRQVSQEMVLNFDGGPLQATAGASYYHEFLENHVIAPFIQFDDPTTPGYDLPYKQDGTLKIDAYAAYLQATYSITPELRITGAGRYSSEKRTTDGTFTFGAVIPTDGSKRWSSFTPKAGIEFDVLPGTMLYASYTKGFKSGTFNVGQVNPAINPEKIESYEAGVKSRLLNNTVDITAAYFHYKYTDLQVQKIIGIATLTTNAAAAKIDGFEVSVDARVTPQFRINANFNYIKGRFSDFCSINPLFPTSDPDTNGVAPGAAECPSDPAGGQDLSGNRLAGSPKYSGVIGAQYTLPVGNAGWELRFNADASYQSRIDFSEFNDDQLSQKRATKVNASATLDSGKNWSLQVWGKNITGVKTANNKLQTIALWGYPIYGSLDAPATYGATMSLNF